jgi:phage/plasmid-associated DNA primase
MLQCPATKPGVMIVLLGGQGTGKGALFALLSRIWAHSVLRVSDIEQIAGRFNAALANAYVVCMDEALFVGDRKSQDKMKSLITEPIISIEQKHQPQHSIESYHRYFAASNHDHFAQIENDDRRYFILPV